MVLSAKSRINISRRANSTRSSNSLSDLRNCASTGMLLVVTRTCMNAFFFRRSRYSWSWVVINFYLGVWESMNPLCNCGATGEASYPPQRHRVSIRSLESQDAVFAANAFSAPMQNGIEPPSQPRFAQVRPKFA